MVRVVREDVRIEDSDAPCRKGCDIEQTTRFGRYIPHSCNRDEMRRCPVWQYRDVPEKATESDAGENGQ